MRTNPRGLIDLSQPIDKRLVAFNTDDLEIVRKIFPENGMQTYLPGLLTKILIKQLAEKGVKEFYDRISGGHYDPTRLIPDYNLVRKECS